MMMAAKPLAHRATTGACLILALLSFFPRPVSASEETYTTISWRSEYGPALEEARAKNQLLWIQFTGPWCPNCARMEQDSFPHPAIRAHAQRSFVPVKLRSDLNEELALGFDLTGLPATVIVAPSREVYAVHQGYLGPDELALFLDQALARQKPREAAIAGKGKSPASTPKPGQGQAATRKHETQLALSGYCPVSLVSNKRLVPGQAEYTVVHQGRLYRFASLITFNLFRRDPERYVPSNAGNCPVAQIERKAQEPGDPRFGVLFQGRLFLCATDADRKKFLDEPARYAAVDVVDQGFCPHCLAENGLYVRGDPRVELKRAGRRYWFPDASHRDAFLAASETTSRRR
jgi:YHS domain-containing protein/thiol-disulfide isomerase/thioredoxin